MSKYKTVSIDPETLDAKQWFKHGDDDRVTVCPYLEIEAEYLCPTCGKLADRSHGLIFIAGENQIICPGDWILTDDSGYFCICTDETFQKKFTKTENNELSEDAAAWRLLLLTEITLQEFFLDPHDEENLQHLNNLRGRIHTFLKTLSIGEKKHDRKE